MQCDASLFAFCFERFADVLRSRVIGDSSWLAVFCQDACEMVVHGMAGHVIEESNHMES